jgi:hypothetical protein
MASSSPCSCVGKARSFQTSRNFEYCACAGAEHSCWRGLDTGFWQAAGRPPGRSPARLGAGRLVGRLRQWRSHLLHGLQTRLHHVQSDPAQSTSALRDLVARCRANRHEVSDLETVVNASHPANQEICFSGDGRAIYAGIKRTFKYYREGPGSHPAPSRPKLV